MFSYLLLYGKNCLAKAEGLNWSNAFYIRPFWQSIEELHYTNTVQPKIRDSSTENPWFVSGTDIFDFQKSDCTCQQIIFEKEKAHTLKLCKYLDLNY